MNTRPCPPVSFDVQELRVRDLCVVCATSKHLKDLVKGNHQLWHQLYVCALFYSLSPLPSIRCMKLIQQRDAERSGYLMEKYGRRLLTRKNPLFASPLASVVWILHSFPLSLRRYKKTFGMPAEEEWSSKVVKHVLCKSERLACKWLDAAEGSPYRPRGKAVGFPDTQALDVNESHCISGDGQNLRVWVHTTDRRIKTLRGHSSNISCVGFSRSAHSDAIISSGDVTGHLKLWSMDELRNVRSLRAHADTISDTLHFSSLCITCSLDGFIKVWDASQAHPLVLTLEGHSRIYNMCMHESRMQRVFFFETRFSGGFGIATSNCRRDLPTPRAVGSYLQVFVRLSTSDLYAKHTEAVAYLEAQALLNPIWPESSAVYGMVEDTGVAIDTLRSLSLWPLRLAWRLWFAELGLLNKSIAQQHQTGKLSFPVARGVAHACVSE